jgi:hypothetical protein
MKLRLADRLWRRATPVCERSTSPASDRITSTNLDPVARHKRWKLAAEVLRLRRQVDGARRALSPGDGLSRGYATDPASGPDRARRPITPGAATDGRAGPCYNGIHRPSSRCCSSGVARTSPLRRPTGFPHAPSHTSLDEKRLRPNGLIDSACLFCQMTLALPWSLSLGASRGSELASAGGRPNTVATAFAVTGGRDVWD